MIFIEKEHGFRISGILVPLLIVFLNFVIIIFPKETLGAAREGLSLWINNVLPSLLPFIVGINILTALGAVNFMGTLLEPIMYPLFRVPGSGGFALASGLMSGYPIGAKVSAELRARETLTQEEAQRLAGFANNSGPLFIIGAVGAGMFNDVSAGYFLYILHFLGAITTGLVLRSYKYPVERKPMRPNKRILMRAYKSMIEVRSSGEKSFGKIIAASIINSMETLIMVGGYIILFCVILNTLEIMRVFDLLESLIHLNGEYISIIIKGTASGAIEMTNGINRLSSLGTAKEAIVAAAGLISWGGLSIQAQSISFLSQTDIKIPFYLFSKLLHSLITILFAFLLYPIYVRLSGAIEVFSNTTTLASINTLSVIDRLFQSFVYFGITICILIFFIIIVSIYEKAKPRRKAR